MKLNVHAEEIEVIRDSLVSYLSRQKRLLKFTPNSNIGEIQKIAYNITISSNILAKLQNKEEQ